MKKNKIKRNIDKKTGKMTFKANELKYKMDKDELEMFLHMKRKGSNVTRDKSKFSRKEKHKRKY